MTWEPSQTWPLESGDEAFRVGAVLIERDFVVRNPSGREQRFIARHRPKTSKLVRRFCLTNMELYAELKDGTRLVIERSQINALEVRGAYLAIGFVSPDDQSESLVHFPPSYGDENQEKLCGLAPVRPLVAIRSTPRSLAWFMLLPLFGLAVLFPNVPEHIERYREGYASLTSEVGMGASAFVGLFIAACFLFIAVRSFVGAHDTRGRVGMSALWVSARKPLRREQPSHDISATDLALPKTTTSSTLIRGWFRTIFTYGAVTLCLFLSALNLFVLSTQSVLPGDTALILLSTCALVALWFLRPPVRVTIYSHELILERRFSKPVTISMLPSERKKNSHCFERVALTDFLILQGNTNLDEPVRIVLNDLEPDPRKRQQLVSDLAALWQLPVIIVVNPITPPRRT